MREITLPSHERLLAAEDAAEPAFHMDETRFRGFYERTARPLWSYLARLTGDPAAADDLLQESYYRFLRAGQREAARLGAMDEAHLKNYLYRISTNLARDRWRRSKPEEPMSDEMPSGERTAETVERRRDLQGALEWLKPRERQLLWLAYVEGSSHAEIAEIAGLRAASVRLLLFRARRKLAEVLRRRGATP
ncbi:MAG TPA: sigma-70 family RNA polymerase sigma factor [Terriglobia bacterium]|nr:sigma-70 family RNA polymerase sigma factor [Terriglobia bacterium]